MDCTCGSEERYRRKSQRIRNKYDVLRKQHKKLLGVSIELTQVLEEYVRGARAPNVTETLNLCEKIYPSLFDELSERTRRIALECSGTKEKDYEPQDIKKETTDKSSKRERRKTISQKVEQLAEDVTGDDPAKADIIKEEIVEEFVDGVREELRKSEKKLIKKELLAIAEEEYYDGFWSKKELPRTPLNTTADCN